MVKIGKPRWNISPSAFDRDVSFHAIIACYGSRGGSSALVARRPRQPATRAGCNLLLFKTLSLFVVHSRAKSSAKPAGAGSEPNLAINFDRLVVGGRLIQKFYGSNRRAGIQQ